MDSQTQGDLCSVPILGQVSRIIWHSDHMRFSLLGWLFYTSTVFYRKFLRIEKAAMTAVKV